MEPWRKIKGRVRTQEEHIGKSRCFTWWMVPITTLHLECGHTKVYRGDYVPGEKARCSACLDPLEPRRDGLQEVGELLVNHGL